MTATSCQYESRAHSGEVLTLLFPNSRDITSLCEHHAWLHDEGFISLT